MKPREYVIVLGLGLVLGTMLTTCGFFLYSSAPIRSSPEPHLETVTVPDAPRAPPAPPAPPPRPPEPIALAPAPGLPPLPEPVMPSGPEAMALARSKMARDLADTREKLSKANVAIEEAKTKVSTFLSVDSALAKLETGAIAFSTPESMNIEDTANIELLVSMNEGTDTLVSLMANNVPVATSYATLSPVMRARLTGNDFEIEEETDRDQVIGSAGETRWKWTIRPRTVGIHPLSLTLAALVDLPSGRATRSFPTYNKKIAVEVTATQQAKTFIASNWQWLWGTLLLPVGAFFWRQRSSAKATSDQLEEYRAKPKVRDIAIRKGRRIR